MSKISNESKVYTKDPDNGKTWTVAYSKEVEVQPASEKNNQEKNNEKDKQTTNDENKSGILKNISNKIIFHLEDGFARLGFLIATHPWKTIFICCVVVAVTALGFLRFSQTTDSTALWVPYGAKVRDYKYWVDEQFPTTYRFVSMIFVADNAALLPSAVHAESLKLVEMNTVYKNSLSLTTTSGQNFSTICAK
ncbi:hypothetical protein KUTeg_016043 [Tegillarca granosa]|uniref:Uncharacterized protein n=1 Tax=Tegillarca granosa TaxID=220873 RepID=A0ABQ9EJR0_TEGGR|nr:hypothetical protein KUTeg_016043 [Tegillarca granosa]